jgi:hypothetical protein
MGRSTCCCAWVFYNSWCTNLQECWEPKLFSWVWCIGSESMWPVPLHALGRVRDRSCFLPGELRHLRCRAPPPLGSHRPPATWGRFGAPTTSPLRRAGAHHRVPTTASDHLYTPEKLTGAPNLKNITSTHGRRCHRPHHPQPQPQPPPPSPPPPSPFSCLDSDALVKRKFSWTSRDGSRAIHPSHVSFSEKKNPACWGMWCTVVQCNSFF